MEKDQEGRQYSFCNKCGLIVYDYAEKCSKDHVQTYKDEFESHQKLKKMVISMKTVNDPRPDLKEDSAVWELLLTTASFDGNEQAFETLKGFRCAGCRLSMSKEKSNLAFNFGTEATDSEKEIIKKHAKEIADYIKDLFKRVYQGIEKVEYEKTRNQSTEGKES